MKSKQRKRVFSFVTGDLWQSNKRTSGVDEISAFIVALFSIEISKIVTMGVRKCGHICIVAFLSEFTVQLGLLDCYYNRLEKYYRC